MSLVCGSIAGWKSACSVSHGTKHKTYRDKTGHCEPLAFLQGSFPYSSETVIISRVIILRAVISTTRTYSNMAIDEKENQA